MELRQANMEDLEPILQLYENARDFMRRSGNPDQWGKNYPPRNMVEQDIRSGASYVFEEEGQLLGVFACLPGPDPTYAKIEDGAWLNDRPYGVIHRVAVGAQRRGIASACLAFGMERFGNLRVDTHPQNIPMQQVFLKNGFTRCGTIFVETGEPFWAYQKCR